MCVSIVNSGQGGLFLELVLVERQHKIHVRGGDLSAELSFFTNSNFGVRCAPEMFEFFPREIQIFK